MELSEKKGTNYNDMKIKKHPLPKRPHLFKGLFSVRKMPFPWKKALIASFSMGIPLWIGLLLHHMDWGMTSMMGAFTALYVGNEPYAQRTKRLFGVLIGLVLAFGLGLLSSAMSPVFVIIGIGIIAFIAKLLTGAFKMPPPGEYFFIMVFGIATSMPIPIASIPMYLLIAFCGGIITIILALSGWVFRAHGPELEAVTKAYLSLSVFYKELLEKGQSTLQHATLQSLRTAEYAVTQGELAWRNTEAGQQLLLLSEQANVLFRKGLGVSRESNVSVDTELPGALIEVATTLKRKNGLKAFTLPKVLQDQLPHYTKGSQIHEPSVSTNRAIRDRSFLGKIADVLQPSSIVFQSSYRLAIILSVVSLISYALLLKNPYWVPVSCAAILSGVNASAIFFRSIHRSVGTIIGVFIAAGIYLLPIHSFEVIIFIMILQFIIESIVAKNYGLAVIFITPLTIMIAETGNGMVSVDTLLHYRLLDIVLGCFLGFIGSLVWWHKPSAKGLKKVLQATIEIEGKLLYHTLQHADSHKQREALHQLQSSLINIRALSDNLIGQISKKERNKVEALWPTVVTVQRLGYQILTVVESNRRDSYTEEELNRLKQHFLTLAAFLDQKTVIKDDVFSILHRYPAIVRELNILLDSVRAYQ